VGAGISGLALAYRLQQSAPSVGVTVLEQRDRPGGTVWTERRDTVQGETGPNRFLGTKPPTRTLCRDPRPGGRLPCGVDAAQRHRYLFWEGKLQPLPHSLGTFLRSDLLSWRGKLGVLAERFRPRRRRDTDESVDAFARRRIGPEAATVLADALVTGIHAGD